MYHSTSSMSVSSLGSANTCSQLCPCHASVVCLTYTMPSIPRQYGCSNVATIMSLPLCSTQLRAPPVCKSILLCKTCRVSENSIATVWVSIYWDLYSVKQMQNCVRRFVPSHSMPKLTPSTANFDYCICLCGLRFELCWKVDFSI
jgi:hypothetical protein